MYEIIVKCSRSGKEINFGKFEDKEKCQKFCKKLRDLMAEFAQIPTPQLKLILRKHEEEQKKEKLA